MISGAYCVYWFRETDLCCLVKLSKSTQWYLTYWILMTKCYPWKTNKPTNKKKHIIVGPYNNISVYSGGFGCKHLTFSVLKLFVFRFYFFSFWSFQN